MGIISERFSRFIELGEEIDTQLCRLEELEAAVGNTGAAGFDSIGRAAGSHADRTGRLAGRIADLKDLIRELTEQERRECRALNHILRTGEDGVPLLRPLERAVIQMHYFDGMTWEQAAEALGRSDRGCRIACQRGLAILDRVYDDADEA